MKLDHLSASSVQSYLECPQRFALEKIVGVPRDEKPSQALGKKIHAELEGYFKGGAAPATPSAYKALSYLPDRSTVRPENVERAFEVYTTTGVKFVGAIDLLPGGSFPHVVDYKTSKAPGRWAKTPEELRDNVQMSAYAFVYLALHRSHNTPVTVQHLYLGTERAQVLPVEATFTVSEIESKWESISGIASDITARADAIGEINKQTIPPELFPKNPSACSKYGGCPHRARCFPDFSHAKENDPYPGVFMPPLSDLMNANKTPAATVPVAIQTAAPVTAEELPPSLPTGILPSDAPAPQAEAPAKAKRGRKPKVETVAAAIEEASTIAAEVFTEGLKPEETMVDIRTEGEPAPLDIYVDCVPCFKGPQRSVQVTFLTDLIAEQAKAICAGEGVDDLDLIKYREGVGLLKAAFRRNPPSGVVVVSSGYYESEVLTVLEPLAWSVTRATKGGR